MRCQSVSLLWFCDNEATGCDEPVRPILHTMIERESLYWLVPHFSLAVFYGFKQEAYIAFFRGSFEFSAAPPTHHVAQRFAPNSACSDEREIVIVL